jgi:DnaJ-class molecular chaperone
MVVDTHLYDILGVDPSIDEHGLKKAYAKKALECHPDKHPDDPDATEKFQRLNEAWEILKDPERRRIYDEHGAEGLRANSPEDFSDLLSHVFGSRQNARRRTRDKVEELAVSLEELFSGAEKAVTIERRVPCSVCGASGCKPGFSPQPCEKCGGRGQVVMVSEMMRTVIQCPACRGEGSFIPEEARCDGCGGDCLASEEREYAVHIEPGTEDGARIVFHGASDEVPQADTGDLVVIVRQLAHAFFERKGANLLFKKQITLSEALFGARFVLQHLDNRKLVVTTDPKAVITPDTIHVIAGEGMPEKGDAFHRGDLFVSYEIEFPKKRVLTREFRHELCKVVPHLDGAKGLDLKADDVVCVMPEKADLEMFVNAQREKTERRNEAYREEDDGDDEEDAGGPRVGCQPM